MLIVQCSVVVEHVQHIVVRICFSQHDFGPDNNIQMCSPRKKGEKLLVLLWFHDWAGDG